MEQEREKEKVKDTVEGGEIKGDRDCSEPTQGDIEDWVAEQVGFEVYRI